MYKPEKPKGRQSRARRRKDDQQRNRLLMLAAIPALAVLIFSVVKLAGYAGELHQSHTVDEELRALYYQTEVPETAQPGETATRLPTRTPRPLYATATPAPLSSSTLAPAAYPDNPGRKPNKAITRLQSRNRDIVGWLTIDNGTRGTGKPLLDQAVVQKDNDYYLRRDYLGYHNDNGSIFLDEAVRLNTRPYTITLYGHNMKSGAMFGCLRQFENLTFYRKSPFLTFTSLYETGRYVIFAVSQVTTVPGEEHFVPFSVLPGATLQERQDIISGILRISIYHTPVDIRADDQLLLMVTCSGDEAERRLVCARRLREDETEAGMLALIQQTVRKAD